MRMDATRGIQSIASSLPPTEAISIQGYIISLIEVFTKSEDLESLNDLHALCRCMQTIRKFFYNVSSM